MKTKLTLLLTLALVSLAHAQQTLPPGPIQFAWTAPLTDETHFAATGYHLYEDANVLGTTDLLTYIVEGLPVGSHTISLTAFNAEGESARVDLAFQVAAPLPHPPNTPQNFHLIPPQLVNISTRSKVGLGGEVLIGGFIIRGETSKRVIARAIGPSLPMNGKLAGATLELHDATGAVIGSNDGWKTAVNRAEILASNFAPANEHESAILTRLPPGAYTVIVRGAGNTAGIGMVEVFDLDGV